MRKPKNSRYSQLTSIQRAIIRDDGSNVMLHDGLNSFTGSPEHKKYFQNALGKFRNSVNGWNTEGLFVNSYIRWCNNPKRSSSRMYETGQSQFENGFAKFIRATNKSQLSILEMDAKVISEFKKWLEGQKGKDGTNLNINTQRRYLSMARTMFEELSKQSSELAQLAPGNIFPNNPFPKAHGGSKPTEVIDDIAWSNLLNACKKSVADVIDATESGWRILNSKEVFADNERRGRGRYHDIDSVLWELKRTFPKYIPAIHEIRKINKDLADAIQYTHRIEHINRPFYPTSADILPFVILLGIYSLANTGPLRSLKWRQTKFQEIMGVERVVFTFEKNRSHSQYTRSFAVDSDDRLSPSELLRFLKRWTSVLRADAGDYKDNIFIFRTRESNVRGFMSAIDSGTDSDSSWNSALKTFLKKYGLPKVSLKMIRISGLDIVRDQNSDDIRAVQAVGGQKASSTIELHYESAGAIRRRNESLSEIMLTHERWVATRGRSDPRGAPDQADRGAATPGWVCIDPFDSPIPGETKGKLCQGFGRCPACPLATIDTSSSYALARLLQLTEEVKDAQTYLDLARWKAAYQPILNALLERWMPSFTNPDVIEAASKASLNKIGRLE